ncbi:MAG: exodeoxyribonuclease V subunit gamma [Xanthomonadales bacterium]|nr:exodeoxyribonuclease V subunit gamma [Xanthomonadales bacterium]
MQKSGIQLFFSHSVERLVKVLAEHLRQQQSEQSLFISPKVLVPNANMQRFLQLNLAQENGVCAHIDFPFLETGLFQLVNASGRFNQQHLNGQHLSWLILTALRSEEIKTSEVFRPIHTYLSELDSKELRSVKQWQLSQKLAMLLLDYESQRPEMINAWLQGRQFFQNSEDKHLVQLEAMQKQLYGHLVEAGSQQNLSTLFQLSHRLRTAKVPMDHQEIHLFTPSRLSQLHRQLILQLAPYMQINIYQLNVCMEYWEDLQTAQELRWQQSHLQKIQSLKIKYRNTVGEWLEHKPSNGEVFAELEIDPEENSLLKFWGKPGREALKLFSDIENDAIHFSINYNDYWLLSEDVPEDSLLHELQKNVLYRSPNLQKINQLTALKSLQMAAAPSIYREVEAVYNSILWNLQQDEKLRQNDIAVLVTDMNTYRFVIEQVFETLNHQLQTNLSYAIVDSSAAIESRYAEAIQLLFTVLEDDFIRSSVFKWLDNPCVKAANQFDDKDWQDWLMAVNYLGIYCGFDHLYPRSEDSVQGVDYGKLFTWQQGLHRLHQSLAILDDDAENLAFLNAEKIGQLSVLLETLYQVKQSWREAKTAAQWEVQLNRTLDLLLAIPFDEPREHYVQMALQQSLIKLAGTQPDLELELEDIKQFIHLELKHIPASKGSYLTGGVVCAALQPMRPIPFSIIYVLGMDEKTFPGQLHKETLDLTHRSRRIGDINSVENKNYLFLETMMCARKKLYLSFVALDLQNDEVIEPSPVLLTLQAACNDLIDFSILPHNSFPVVDIPLNACDGFELQQTVSQYSDWLVNYSYTDLLRHYERLNTGNWPQAGNINQQLQLDLFRQTNCETKTLDSQNSITETNQEIIHVDASELADFLINPQVAVLKKQGLVSKHPEDLSMVEVEPQDISGLLKHHIFTAAIESWLQNPQTEDFSQVLQKQYQQQLVKSKAPVDLFASLEDFVDVPQMLVDKLKPHLTNNVLLGDVRLGNTKSQQAPAISVQGITLKLETGQQVLVSGLAEGIYVQDSVFDSQIVISSSVSDDAGWNKKLAKPFINWCLWQLSNEIQVNEPFKVHLVFPKKIHTIELKPWITGTTGFSTRSTISHYLHMLVSDYLYEQSVYLPFELLDKLDISRKEEIEPLINLFKTNSSKSVNFLAYAPENLDAADLQDIENKYLSKAEWSRYEEILKLMPFRFSSHPIDDYRRYLLPLYAMYQGQFDDSTGNRS